MYVSDRPKIEEQVRQQVREELREVVGDASCECDPAYWSGRCLVCRLRAALDHKGDTDTGPTEHKSTKGGAMFQPGEKLFIRTVTFHHVGEVEAAGEGFVKLKNASWVAESGRFHVALGEGELDETEYVGTAYVNVATIVDVFPWAHDLPTESQ